MKNRRLWHRVLERSGVHRARLHHLVPRGPDGVRRGVRHHRDRPSQLRWLRQRMFPGAGVRLGRVRVSRRHHGVRWGLRHAGGVHIDG